MAGDEGEVVEEDRPVLHRYRLCEVTESNGKGGRPKRNELISWEDQSDEEVARLRQLHEPRLKARQVAELDGRTVARGANLSAVEIEESEPVQAPPSIRGDNPLEMVEFGRRMSWDIYQRDAAASERLRNEVHELNQRALETQKQVIEQGKMVLELLNHLHVAAQRPPPAPPEPQGRPMTLEDISKLIQVGAVAVREVLKPDK